MEKKKVYWMIGMFLIGAVVGAVITSLSCAGNWCSRFCKPATTDTTHAMFSKEASMPDTGMSVIPADTANAYYRCYMKAPRSISKLSAFAVNLEQLNAMKQLSAHLSTARGFRIYMGIKGDPISVNMVVATDVAGKDICSEVYLTKVAEPCPTACDDQSQITK